MNDENNNNIDNINNMQSNPGILPGLEPKLNNDGFVLPGMDNSVQNPNQTYEDELGLNMNQNMQQPVQNKMQDSMQQPMNNNLYQTNQDMNINPYANMEMPYGNPNQEMNGQYMTNNPYQSMAPNMNFNPYNNDETNQPMGEQFQNINQNDAMNGQFHNMPQSEPMGVMPQMDYGNMDNPQFEDMGMNDQMEQPTYQNFDTGMNDGDLETQFVKTWMGSLYEKSVTKKFNWCAALLGSAYLLYRKIYLTGIITFLLQIVIIIAGIVLSTKMPAVGVAIVSVISLVLFAGLGLSFYGLYRNYIKRKLQVYSRQSSDINQLIDIASQKGGTSIIGVLVELILLGTIPLIVTVLISSGIMSLSPTGNNINTNVTTNNTIVEEVEKNKNTSVFVFDNEYSLSYDMSEWYLDETNKTLTKGNYSLAYATKFTSQQCRFDLSSADGRAGLLKYMTDLFNAQVTQSNMQLETGYDNFISQNERYYNYIDFITANTTQRYYFIVLPEYNMLFQFTLSINDTSIDDKTNLEIIEMVTNIEKNENSQANMPSGLMTKQNEVTNTINNEVAGALSNENENIQSNSNGASVYDGSTQQQQATTTTENTVTNVVTSQNANQPVNSTSLSQFIQ